jgi:tRNA U34 2-thiouridine synthase MnmA/TrmU
MKIMFNTPQMSVAPGQSAVLYAEDSVFGGGIIEQAV